MFKQWKLRLNAFANWPPILCMLREAGSGALATAFTLRTLSALIPIARLGVSRIIIDALTALSQNKPTQVDPWFWVSVEFGLACLLAILSRTTGYAESVLLILLIACIVPAFFG